MDTEDIKMLLRWLNPEAGPVLVQLPEEEYARLRDALNLP